MATDSAPRRASIARALAALPRGRAVRSVARDGEDLATRVHHALCDLGLVPDHVARAAFGVAWGELSESELREIEREVG